MGSSNDDVGSVQKPPIQLYDGNAANWDAWADDLRAYLREKHWEIGVALFPLQRRSSLREARAARRQLNMPQLTPVQETGSPAREVPSSAHAVPQTPQEARLMQEQLQSAEPEHEQLFVDNGNQKLHGIITRCVTKAVKADLRNQYNINTYEDGWSAICISPLKAQSTRPQGSQSRSTTLRT